MILEKLPQIGEFGFTLHIFITALMAVSLCPVAGVAVAQ